MTALAGCSGLAGDTDAAEIDDGDWHSYGKGPLNRNRVPGGIPEPSEYETLTSAGWTYTPPVVHNDIVYFATDSRVVAVGIDGTEQWSRDLDSEVSGVPALDPDRGRLYVPTRVVQRTNRESTPAFVTTLSLADGSVIGTHQIGGDRAYGVTVVDGDLYARSATACVRLGPDGTERWRRRLDPLVYDEYNLGDSTATQVAPAVTEDGVYIPDRDVLVRIDRETGKENWRVSVDTPYAATVVDDSGVIQTGWQEIVAVDHSGDVRWRRDLQSRASAGVAGSDIYVAADDLHELDASTGQTNWQAHLPDSATAAPVVTDTDVLVAAGDVRAFRRTVGDLFSTDRLRWRESSVHAGVFSSPVVAAGHTFVVGPSGLQALQHGEDS
jgi:hypothetical protein